MSPLIRTGILTVVHNLVAGLVHAQEREVVHVLEGTLLLTVDGVGFELLAVELLLTGEVNGVGGIVVAVPVADPVGVTGPHQDLDTGLDHVGQLVEVGLGV